MRLLKIQDNTIGPHLACTDSNRINRMPSLRLSVILGFKVHLNSLLEIQLQCHVRSDYIVDGKDTVFDIDTMDSLIHNTPMRVLDEISAQYDPVAETKIRELLSSFH